MSKRFFTSDLHLGSNLINKYAHRPFASAVDAAKKLVNNCNEVAKKQDVVFHVGDFWLNGKDRHDDVEDENTLTATVDDYINSVNARLVLLEGNHDTSNVETDLKSMYVDLNQNYRNVYVSHFPSYHEFYRGPKGWAKGFHIVLCGHVHDSWKVMFDVKKHVLNVNVGIDAWEYNPVEDVQITELLDFITDRSQIQKFTQQNKNVYWKQSDIDAAKVEWKRQIEIGRQERKTERYIKKGLTPEECERRKIEAMKAKGLDPNFKKNKKKSNAKENAFIHEDAVQFGMLPPDTVDMPIESCI